MADIGARLRASREAKRLSLDAVAASTRVKARILSAIEQNDPAALPPRPYGRGFVRAYARELGLNADDIVRDYFGQFAPPEPVPAPPLLERPTKHLQVRPLLDALPLRFVATVAIAILLVTGSWLVSHRTSDSAAAQQEAVGTSGHAAPQSSGAPAAESRAPAPPSAALTLVLSATAPCWVTASADGNRVLYRALQPGERVSLQGNRTVSVRTGNAGGVTWTLNGRAMGAFGRPGEVRTMRITPDGIALIDSSAQD